MYDYDYNYCYSGRLILIIVIVIPSVIAVAVVILLRTIMIRMEGSCSECCGASRGWGSGYKGPGFRLLHQG